MNILERLNAQLEICKKNLDKEGIKIYTNAIENIKKKAERF